ncbi:MAG: hypothetical protein KKF22_05980 [Gammaproteobacteria bacterium]|nr:hypothetical protein [Gammaproteobacteria bacterium]
MLKSQLYLSLIHNLAGLEQLARCPDLVSFTQCLRQILRIEQVSDHELLLWLEAENSVCISPELDLFSRFWLPVAYKKQTQEVLWLPALNRPVQSYFAEYVTETRANLLASLIRPKTSLTALLNQEDALIAVEPSGFIFHLSRCGSTLVSRSVAVSESYRVIAESDVFTSVLQDQQLEELQRNRALKLMVSLQGRLRGKEQRLVVKWNAWDLCFIQQIKQLYPNTPFVFLTRQPLDILASHQKSAGWHMVPLQDQLRLFDWPVADCEEGGLLHYQQKVLQQLMQWMLHYSDLKQVLIIDYQKLPQAVEEQILPFFCLSFSTVELQLMTRSQLHYSKNPQQLFQPDGWKQNHFEGSRLTELTQQLSPLYQRLVAYA